MTVLMGMREGKRLPEEPRREGKERKRQLMTVLSIRTVIVSSVIDARFDKRGVKERGNTLRRREGTSAQRPLSSSSPVTTWLRLGSWASTRVLKL